MVKDQRLKIKDIMCLAIPGKIISLRRGRHAVVSFNGLHKEVNLELVPEAKRGDFVTVHTGFAIGVVSQQDAQKAERLIRNSCL